MKKIPLKNYIFLVLLVGVTVFITYYCCNLYTNQHESKYTSIMHSFLAEIKEDDIEDYVKDNPTVVLYISDKKDKDKEQLEKEFKELLTEKHIYSYFVYVDISSDKEKSLQNFQENYQLELDYQSLPILVVFEDGEVSEVYHTKEWNVSEITEFLKRNEVIDCG